MKAEKRCSFALSSSGLTDSSDLSEGNMVRTVIAVLFVVVYCIISVPILLVETVIRKFNKKAAELSMLRIVQVAFRILLFICGTKITVLRSAPFGDPMAIGVRSYNLALRREDAAKIEVQKVG